MRVLASLERSSWLRSEYGSKGGCRVGDAAKVVICLYNDMLYWKSEILHTEILYHLVCRGDGLGAVSIVLVPRFSFAVLLS